MRQLQLIFDPRLKQYGQVVSEHVLEEPDPLIIPLSDYLLLPLIHDPRDLQERLPALHQPLVGVLILVRFAPQVFLVEEERDQELLLVQLSFSIEVGRDVFPWVAGLDIT